MIGCPRLVGCLVTKSCLTFATPWTVCSLPGSSVHRVLEARILEWVASSFGFHFLTLRLFVCFGNLGFPGGASGQDPTCHCKTHNKWGFNSLVGKIPLEEEMATHSSILAWIIPWTEEPGGLESTGSQRFGQDWTHRQAFQLNGPFN